MVDGRHGQAGVLVQSIVITEFRKDIVSAPIHLRYAMETIVLVTLWTFNYVNKSHAMTMTRVSYVIIDLLNILCILLVVNNKSIDIILRSLKGIKTIKGPYIIKMYIVLVYLHNYIRILLAIMCVFVLVLSHTNTVLRLHVYVNFPALLVEEDARCQSVHMHYCKHERAPMWKQRCSISQQDFFLT